MNSKCPLRAIICKSVKHQITTGHNIFYAEHVPWLLQQIGRYPSESVNAGLSQVTSPDLLSNAWSACRQMGLSDVWNSCGCQMAGFRKELELELEPPYQQNIQHNERMLHTMHMVSFHHLPSPCCWIETACFVFEGGQIFLMTSSMIRLAISGVSSSGYTSHWRRRLQQCLWPSTPVVRPLNGAWRLEPWRTKPWRACNVSERSHQNLHLQIPLLSWRSSLNSAKPKQSMRYYHCHMKDCDLG